MIDCRIPRIRERWPVGRFSPVDRLPMNENATGVRPAPRRVAGLSGTVLATLCLLFAGGCGYTMEGSVPTGSYKWKSLYSGDIHTVAVPIFTNRTYYRGVEFGLTKAIINQLEGQSPYKVVPKEQADTILIGSIENVHVNTLSLDARGRVIPQEQLLVLDVNFTWKDLRTGKILRNRTDFEQTAPYYPTLGETQFLAQQQSVEILALAIVRELQADW
jgi:outer membrane lipopolysaccharide assembly protein LptE/RlpB